MGISFLGTANVGGMQQTQRTFSAQVRAIASGMAETSPASTDISQQMQNQILAMEKTYQDIKAGVSMLTTADGALGQIQDLLNSMYSLATQSASDSNVNIDRASIQSQIDQYTAQIDTLTNNTAFNNLNLLDGVLGPIHIVDGPQPGNNLTLSLQAADAGSLGISAGVPQEAVFTNVSAPAGALGPLTLLGANNAANPYGSRGLLGGNYAVQITGMQDATLNGTDINSAGASPTQSTAVATEGNIGAGWILYDGNTSTQVMVKIQTGASPGVVQSLKYSLDGGKTYMAATTDAFGDYTLGDTGITVLASGITTNSTPLATDTYSMSVTPAAATLSLVNQNGNTLGSATTVRGISTDTQNLVVGDPNTGQAIQVGYNSAALFGLSPYLMLIVNGTAPAASVLNNNFEIMYGSGQSATGSGGAVVSPATVSGGLSVMSYNLATIAQGKYAAAMTQVSAERAQIGAFIDRLQLANHDAQASGQNLAAARAQVADTNIASASTKAADAKALLNMETAVATSAEQTPQAFLKLLPNG